MEIDLIAAYWSLEQLPTERLPEIAQEALEEGLDSPSLRILAGERGATMSELNSLFKSSLSELNIEIPPIREAAMHIARHHAKNITSGRVSPIEGARQITREAYYLVEGLNELIAFVALIDQFEEFTEAPQKNYYGEENCKNVLIETEEEIVKEAKRLVAENDS